MMAAVSNRYAGIFFLIPGSDYGKPTHTMDVQVMGYPETAHGNITSGGSVPT
jgi:hypothetical protein